MKRDRNFVVLEGRLTSANGEPLINFPLRIDQTVYADDYMVKTSTDGDGRFNEEYSFYSHRIVAVGPTLTS